MAKQTINIGASPNDGTGTPLRTAFDYTNQNFTELYTATGPSGNNIVVPGSATITGALTAGGNSVIGTGSTQNAAANRGNLTIGGTVSAILNLSIGSGDTGYLLHDGTSISFFNRVAGGSLIFGANSTEQMRLNSTGLGVGGTPITKFFVQDATLTGSSQIREQVIRAASDNTNNSFNSLVGFTFSAASAAYSAGSLVRSSGVYGINLDNTAFGRVMGLSFYTCAQDAAATEKMRIDSSGNVGVGVTPSAWGAAFKAIEFGTIGSISSTGVATRFSGNSYNNGTNFIYKSSSVAACLYEMNSGEHRFSVAPSGTAGNAITFTQAMTLDASGNLLVGTTSAGGNRLNVQTASGDCTTLIKSQAANVNSAIDYVSSYGNHTIRKSGTAVWDFGVINDSSATPAFKISNASAVGVQLVSGATAWTTLSDETVKDIIEPIGNAVAKVGSLRSVIGKFKTDSEGTRRSFLIAQDVKSVLPEAVDVVGENNELGLRYTEVIPLLVAAIKELTARVQTLEAK
jgi:hypothetical protein